MAIQPVCRGFKAAGVVAGLKKNGKPDLALIFSEVPATVAGVFTRNKVQAAPVRYDRQRIQSGRCQAVIVNSGNANCCTGQKGMAHAARMAQVTAAQLGIAEDLVLVASTGVIGEPLPIEKIDAAAPELVKSLQPDGVFKLAEAIMTTDTVPKIVFKEGRIRDKPFTILGVAKGAGMIHPDMATMLSFICTDVEISAEMLQEALNSAVRHTFNRITIDGDTSTNDTALVLANGLSGVRISDSEALQHFQPLLNDACLELAKMLVKDGEGATKLVEIRVKGARSALDAHRIANTIAGSNLVKTAFFGEDANWGRILGAAGRADVPIDPDRIDVFFNDVQMVKAGMGCGKSVEAEATRVLKTPEFTVTIDLHLGSESDSVYTCDFSLDYVRINADYRS
ncbi:MAG: bifunctional glutamate N-acetyltransferase/amino-acid acetyltransferase ArgJ [Desulfobacterales bacterium]|nr:bifunctional glutamate N-acetyltransferase/amino-acid acetyltransferase ArgJ [Desulfobacterales bacterium]